MVAMFVPDGLPVGYHFNLSVRYGGSFSKEEYGLYRLHYEVDGEQR